MALPRAPMSDPKPAKRHRASKEEWEEIRAILLPSPCRLCDEPARELHHLYPRAQGGDDVTVNLIPLCRDCHRRIEERDPATNVMLRLNLSDGNYAYLAYKLGERWDAWLARRYSSDRRVVA